MSADLLDKLRMQKKFRNLKSIKKLLENSTQLEEYLTGSSHPWPDSIEPLPSNGFVHMDKDLHYLFETDPLNNGTRVTEIRAGDIRLADSIDDNFYYQHMFNFALVVILLLQVIVVWAFIWCRLSKYSKQSLQSHREGQMEDGIALRDIGHLPEIIPRQQQIGLGGDLELDGNMRIGGGMQPVIRCARYG